MNCQIEPIDTGVRARLDGTYLLDFTDPDDVDPFMNRLDEWSNLGLTLSAIIYMLLNTGVIATMNRVGDIQTWFRVVITDPGEADDVIAWCDTGTADARIRQLRAIVAAHLENPAEHPRSPQGLLELVRDELDRLCSAQLRNRRIQE